MNVRNITKRGFVIIMRKKIFSCLFFLISATFSYSIDIESILGTDGSTVEIIHFETIVRGHDLEYRTNASILPTGENGFLLMIYVKTQELEDGYWGFAFGKPFVETDEYIRYSFVSSNVRLRAFDTAIGHVSFRYESDVLFITILIIHNDNILYRIGLKKI